MLRANEVGAPLRKRSHQSGYIKKIALPKKEGNGVVNFLTTNPDIISFFNGTSVDYSQLVPQMQIYKVYISKGNGGIKNIEEHPFPFGALTNWNDMSEAIKKSGRLFRGKEAGIQSIDLKMEGRGRNPVSANVMDISVKYFFNDVKTLFEPLAKLKGNGSMTSFADLIRFPQWNRDSSDFTQRAFRIRLVLGWSLSPTISSAALDLPEGFADAISASKISIAADLYTHSMEFNEDGSLILTAKYKGALETAFGDADILTAGVSPSDKDGTIQQMKQKIRAAEDAYAQGAFTKRFEGFQRSFQQVLTIERAIEELDAARKALEGASKSDRKRLYANVGAALKTLEGKYEKFRENRKGKQPLASLQGAVRDKGKDERSTLERENQAKLAKLRKRYEKGGRSKKAKKLKRAITRLRNELKKYQKSIKGRHMFNYIQLMQKENKLAYIPTGRGTNFGNYNNLLETLKRYGGSDSEVARSKMARALENARRKKGGDRKGAVTPYFDLDYGYNPGRTSRNGTAGVFSRHMSSKGPSKSRFDGILSNGAAPTVDPRLAADMVPQTRDAFTLRSLGADASVASPGSLTIDGLRSTTEYGDAIVWEDVKRPKYLRGPKTYFFRLGDLLSVILENGDFGKKLNQESPNFKLLLGEYDLPYGPDQTLRMNLYDLPVSLEIFHVFVAQKIVGTGRAIYPFLQFTFDLIKFIMDKTQNVFGKAAEFLDAELIPVSFKMDLTSLDLPTKQIETLTDSGVKDTIRIDGMGPNHKSKHLNTLTVDAIRNTSSTFLFHAQKRLSKMDKTIYNGVLQEDEKRGIFHFFVGGPKRGIMKKINFTQAANNLFSMALMRNGQAGGAKSSREGIIQPSKFVCEVTLVGNPFFYIGQMFYVNTDLISGGHFASNGILNGGYYIVTEVTNSVRPGGWETKIRGVLQIPDHALKKVKDRNSQSVETLRMLEKEERERAKKMAAQGPKPPVPKPQVPPGSEVKLPSRYQSPQGWRAPAPPPKKKKKKRRRK